MLTGGIENRTLRERVEEYLRAQILGHSLEPGAIISEADLARSLGVSRGPVREAINRLAAEGLVVVRPRRGVTVAEMDDRALVEAYQVREALEVLAIRLATPRVTDAQVADLRRLQGTMRKCAAKSDVPGFFEANEAFHRLLVDASGNETLVEMYRQLVGRVRIYRLRTLTLRGDLERPLAEHDAIIDAVAERDAAAAAQRLGEHIHVPQERLEDA